MSVLAFENIHRAYQKNRDVLAGVSFALEPGEVVGLVGRNGAGKTTLIRISMGMIEAQQGAVRVFGLNPRVSPVEVKRRVGYVSEDQILPEFLRVREVLALHRELFPTWDLEMERSLIDQFRVDPSAKIRNLSKGQARQVALLCAVCHRPELLLLDEPAGGLDPAVRREFLETAIRLLNEAGTTILFSSHYMGDIERIASRVVLLDELREGFSLVLVPATNGTTRERLQELPRCVGVRQRGGTHHAILRLHSDNARSVVERELGVATLAVMLLAASAWAIAVAFLMMTGVQSRGSLLSLGLPLPARTVWIARVASIALAAVVPVVTMTLVAAVGWDEGRPTLHVPSVALGGAFERFEAPRQPAKNMITAWRSVD